MSNFTKKSFADTLDELNEIVRILSSCGIEFSKTRLGHYHRSLSKLTEMHNSKCPTYKDRRFQDDINTIYEIRELVCLMPLLPLVHSHPYLQDKLEKVVSGPILYLDENTKTSSNSARNFMFELLISARLVQSGIRLVHDVGDAACLIQAQKIIFQCKRPTKKDSLEKRVADAFKQLGYDFCQPNRSYFRGLVAVDITKITNPYQNSLLVKDRNDLNTCLQTTLEEFIRSNENLWQRKTRSPSIIGVLARFATMSFIDSEGPVPFHCVEYALSPMPDINLNDRLLVENLTISFQETISV